MKKNKKSLFTFLLILLSFPVCMYSQSNDPVISDRLPIIPIGLDAYSMWDKLPYHKIGIRAYMRSTYDRNGNNRGADGSHYLYQVSDTFNVSLDVKGQGILYFKRTNYFHGSPWHYEIDGENNIVKETATDEPLGNKDRFKEVTFIPEKLFPNPLVYTWMTTRGGDLMWVPLGFEESLRLAYSKTFYGTGYYIYHMIPKGTTHLSRPMKAWDKTPPDSKVLDLLNNAGSDIVDDKTAMHRLAARVSVGAYETQKLAALPTGPNIIRSFKMKIPLADGFDFGQARLKVTWDNNWHASIDAPIGLFFGAGELYNGEDKEYLVKGLPLSVRYDKTHVYLSCYWPMPYFSNAVFEIQDRNGKSFESVEYEIFTEKYTGPLNHLNYFHATYTDHPNPVEGEDIVYLDTRKTEGGGDWSGHFVGMTWIFSRDGNLIVCEGDPRFFFDDSQTPQAWGTGSEEWGGGGNHWGGLTMTIPLAGHAIGKSKTVPDATEKDLINSAYRFLIADYFPFGKRAVVGLEHGPYNDISEHISGVAYWYGVNKPSLVLTDELNVCNESDRNRHNYSSPTASDCYALVSRYEWGADSNLPDQSRPPVKIEGRSEGSVSYFLAQEDSVRYMTGTTEFKVKVRKDNHGVMLRRKFDYKYPNQEAKIFIRKPGSTEWQYVDNWYTSGSNTCYWSWPFGVGWSEAEFAPTDPYIITSNRRWREEEFVISSSFTRDLEEMEIKIEFVPNTKELLPGIAFPAQSAWSEARYWVFSYVLPDFDYKAAASSASIMRDKGTVSKKTKTYIPAPGSFDPVPSLDKKDATISLQEVKDPNAEPIKPIDVKASDPIQDIDGNTYKTVSIGNQIWMAENLAVSRLNDGTDIPLVTNNKDWDVPGKAAYTWYNNDQSFKKTYGALYNYYAVNTDKLCPEGWNVPSSKDWDILQSYLGGSEVAGGRLKETGHANWSSPNNDFQNDAQFNAIPGGLRFYSGKFGQKGELGFWWTSTETETRWERVFSQSRALSYKSANLHGKASHGSSGMSVRCIKGK
jgi:uncharacterized protein (TIGR02145 family)